MEKASAWVLKKVLFGVFEWQNMPLFTSDQQEILMRSSALLINVLFFITADLKRICETENGSLEIKDERVRQMLKKNGLATQCIQAKNARLCKDMTLAQLCLKINSKMGGANNAIANNSITRLVSLCGSIINIDGIWHVTVKKDVRVYFLFIDQCRYTFQ